MEENLKVSSKTIDEIDEAREKEDLKKLEAVFFISGRWLNISELISLSDLNPIILRELIETLKNKYERADSAIEIVEKNGLWKMDVSQEYDEIINKLATGSAEFTKAEQETLAIIAYKQPMKQSVIIKIRGNKAYDHIKKFSDLNLILKKRAGHTYELSLSEDFYDYFSVQEKGEGNKLPEEIIKDAETGTEEVREDSEKKEVDEIKDSSTSKKKFEGDEIKTNEEG